MEELKIYDDGTFDMKVIKAIRVGEQITVHIESPFGLDKVKISSKKDYLHITGVKKWEYEAKKLISNKYKSNFKNTDNIEVDLLTNG